MKWASRFQSADVNDHGHPTKKKYIKAGKGLLVMPLDWAFVALVALFVWEAAVSL